MLSFSLIKLVGQGFSLLAPLLIAKFLSPSLFGGYSLSKTIIFFFSSLLIASAQTPFIVNANQERNLSGKINKSFSVQIIFLIISISIYILVNLVLGKYLQNFAGITRLELFSLFLAYTGLTLYRFIGNLFLALNMRLKHSWIDFFFGLFNVLSVLLLFIFHQLSLNNIFYSYLVSAILLLIFFPIFLRRTDYSMLFPFVIDKKLFKETIGYISWIMFGSVGVYLVNWGDNLVLRHYVSFHEIGVYNLSYEVFKGLVMSTFILGSYFTPFIATNIKNSKKISNYLFSKRWKLLLIIIFGLFLLYFNISVLIRLVYKSEYSQSVPILKMLIFGALLAAYNTFYIPIIISLKKFRFSQIVNIGQFAINIIFDIVLIPRMGIMGGAVATVIGYGFKMILYEIYFFRHYPQYSLKYFFQLKSKQIN